MCVEAACGCRRSVSLFRHASMVFGSAVSQPSSQLRFLVSSIRLQTRNKLHVPLIVLPMARKLRLVEAAVGAVLIWGLGVAWTGWKGYSPRTGG